MIPTSWAGPIGSTRDLDAELLNLAEVEVDNTPIRDASGHRSTNRTKLSLESRLHAKI